MQLFFFFYKTLQHAALICTRKYTNVDEFLNSTLNI